MSKVRIVTDSTADIPAEVREELGITMISLKVLFGEETYRDAVDLTPEEFYSRLKASTALPKTSQPSPAEFLEVYEQLLAEDPTAPIISVHLASVLSGTYQSATIAKSMVEVEGADITVVDSCSASYGHGAQVVLAAQMAQSGASVDEIVAAMKQCQNDNTGVYFLVDTLDYLQKGGRIGKASAMIGSLLNIKPILSLEPNGTVTAVDKARGTKRRCQRLLSFSSKAMVTMSLF